jgi:hypothetical protein
MVYAYRVLNLRVEQLFEVFRDDFARDLAGLFFLDGLAGLIAFRHAGTLPSAPVIIFQVFQVPLHANQASNVFVFHPTFSLPSKNFHRAPQCLEDRVDVMERKF